MTTEQPDAGHGHASRIARLVLVLLALVPMLASSPGRVSADSRQYLYLRPGAFLERAISLWDPSVAAGTVPHQHLGFLWPMGPWFWLVDVAGLPMWIGQRLWMAAVAAAAGLGAYRLARAVGCAPLAAFVAGVVYQLTPYQLAFTARFSVLLLPWAALPWLVHLARRAVHERTWRAPLAFGIVASTAGAVNASSLLLVLLAPGIVLLASMAAGPWRPAVAAAARVAMATVVASAWWLGGLVVQGRFGLPVLQLTENVDTVSAASRPDDIVRGLGNWIFTSTDGAATAIEQAAAYADSTLVRLATVALPALALLVIAAVRFRGRGAVAAAMGVAVVVGAGAAPLGSSSRFGELWRRVSESSSIGLALRNTPRIVPVIVLGSALALGLGLERLVGRARIVAAAGVVALAAVAISPVVTHGFLSDDFDRPEDLPARWTQVADDLDTIDLDAAAPGTRVLELPGANFAAYTWGNTVEPVLPGLTERPTIAREVLPAGGFGTVDLLAALDRGLLLGTFDDASLAPVARLLGVGDIVIRGDLDVDRFGLPPVGPLIGRLDQSPPPGFRVTGRYGTDDEGRPLLLRLTLDESTRLVRADGGAPVLLAGDGDGIVDAAAAGLVDGRRTILPSVTTGAVGLDDALTRGAEVVVTDTNRKAASTFFYTIVDDEGATETAGATEPDPTGYDVRFGPYAEAPTSEKTVAVQLGGTVTTSMGGGPEHPENRAVLAFDGSSETAWRPRAGAVGQHVEVRYDEPVVTDTVMILTTADAPVTAIRLTVDGITSSVTLGPEATRAPGQAIPLAAGRVRELTVEITGVAPVRRGAPGIADVGVGGAVVDEVLRTPTALVERIGDQAAGRRVSYVLSRRRGDVLDSLRAPVERDIDRFFTTAVAADHELSGTVSLAGPPPAGCRDDLVRIDGAPVPVSIAPDGRLTGCTALSLVAGEHRLTTAAAGSGTTDVDRLVLTSGPIPSAHELLTPTDVVLGTRSAAATVETTDPFWFTLAESRNDGWKIDVQGGAVRATSMTDGYANGWLVVPEGDGPVTIRLSWEPQRIVWAGFAITGLLVPALIVVFGGGRRVQTVADDVGSSEWHASSVGAISLPGRLAGLSAFAVGWALLWWFVADTTVAAVAIGALAARTSTHRSRWPLAALAALAVVGAEFTDRPSLVFAGFALAAGEIVVSALLRDQDLISAWNDTPGSAGRGYQ